MDPTHGQWFSILIMLLLGGAAGLRIAFAAAPRRAESIALGVTAALFFSLCALFLRR
jgi:hypothetical protein